MSTELDTDWVNPLDAPQASNEAINSVIKPSGTSEYPVIGYPADDLVVLPGGLVTPSATYTTAVVRELTGEDEEALAKAMQSSNPFHFVDTLLERGTVRIGDAPESQTKGLLRQLLIGDRDAIILGIRRATYGDDIEFEKWICPHPQCQTETDLTLTVDEIKVQKLENLSDIEFEVPLRKGGKALVRLPNGADQKKVYENVKLSDAEKDSVLLTQIVSEIVDKSGMSKNVVAQPSLMRDMGVADRKKILKEVVKRQPGPKYDGVTFTHEDCGEEVSLLITVGDLFLDLL